MTDSPPPEAPSHDIAIGDRLDSWKEIAAYLRRDVTTAQRWEKREGMPVHRHVHDKVGSVYAFRSELDAWALRRRSSGVPDAPEAPMEAPVEAAWDGAADGHPQPAAEPAAAPRAPLLPRAWSSRGILWAGALIAVVVGVVGWQAWWRQSERDGTLADASVIALTNFGGVSQAAAVSRDGRYAAFLSDRDGRKDLWVTQIGTGVFYNRTRDAPRELVNPAVRTVGFTPDGANVTFWVRGPGRTGEDISIWAAPVLGGQPRLYLEGVAEYDFSRDGRRLVYHTPGPGDPTFVRDALDPSHARLVFSAPSKRHSHFPTWSPDQVFIYFVQGQAPEQSVAGMPATGVGLWRSDIWRVKAEGGHAERLTHHNAFVSHPVFIDARRLLYLATDPDGAGPFIHSLDVERRTTRRLGFSGGIERYTSLAASADGTRLVATLARPSGTLWRLPISGGRDKARRIALSTGNGSSPRLGMNYLVYVSSKGTTDSIWKLQGDAATELWSAPNARIVGGPAISRDGRRMAFSVRQRDRVTLHVANTDGTGAKTIPASITPEGDPAWTPDGRSLTIAALVDGVPRLFSVHVDTGHAVRFVDEHSVDPVWSPDGTFVVFSGADVGTTFPLRAAASDGTPHRLPSIKQLTRGGRRLVFLPGQRTLVVLRGEISHKNLWAIDVETGAERQLTDFPQDFDIRDFDVSPDGTELVIEQVQERSEIVLFERARQR